MNDVVNAASFLFENRQNKEEQKCIQRVRKFFQACRKEAKGIPVDTMESRSAWLEAANMQTTALDACLEQATLDFRNCLEASSKLK